MQQAEDGEDKLGLSDLMNTRLLSVPSRLPQESFHSSSPNTCVCPPHPRPSNPPPPFSSIFTSFSIRRLLFLLLSQTDAETLCCHLSVMSRLLLSNPPFDPSSSGLVIPHTCLLIGSLKGDSADQ